MALLKSGKKIKYNLHAVNKNTKIQSTNHLIAIAENVKKKKKKIVLAIVAMPMPKMEKKKL